MSPLSAKTEGARNNIRVNTARVVMLKFFIVSHPFLQMCVNGPFWGYNLGLWSYGVCFHESCPQETA
jgi:hypothetical protein